MSQDSLPTVEPEPFRARSVGVTSFSSAGRAS